MAGIPLSAQTDAINGVCFSGGRSATTQGLTSSNKLDGIIPSCSVSVFITGTTTRATIYSDALNTPLANPFIADNLTAAAPGKWLFFATTGQGYDVVMSGGISPLVYTAPVTLTDLKVGGSGGGGGGISAAAVAPIRVNAGVGPVTTGLATFDCPTCLVGIGPGTQFFLPIWNTTTTLGDSEWSQASDGTTTTFHGSGGVHAVSLPEGTAATPAAGQEIINSNASLHTLDLSQNGGAFSPICTAANGECPGGGGGGGSFIANVPLPISICQSTSSATGLSLAPTNAPTPFCVSGTTFQKLGTLHFPTGSLTSAQMHFPLPSDVDCTQPFNMTLNWQAVPTSGSVIWSIQTQFTAAGQTLDHAWNTAATATTTAPGTTLDTITSSITGIPKTGCAAGSEAYILVQRNGNSDSMADDAQLISANLTYTRTLGIATGTFNVNGSSIANPNLNATTPAAPGGNVNCTWQVTGSSVSCYIPNTSVTALFSAVGSGTNTTAAMVLGTGSSLTVSGSGTNNATAIAGVTVSGPPSVNQVLTATSPTAANWQSPNLNIPPAFKGYIAVADTTAASVTSSAISIAAGDLLAVSCRFGTGSTGVATDSQSNTYTPLTARINGGVGLQMSWAIASTTASTTFTCTNSGSAAGISLIAMHWSGTGTTSNTSTGGTGQVSPTFNTTQRTLDIYCSAVGAITTWTPNILAGHWAELEGVSDAGIAVSSDQGCQATVTTAAIAGATGFITSGNTTTPVNTVLAFNY